MQIIDALPLTDQQRYKMLCRISLEQRCLYLSEILYGLAGAEMAADLATSFTPATEVEIRTLAEAEPGVNELLQSQSSSEID